MLSNKCCPRTFQIETVDVSEDLDTYGKILLQFRENMVQQFEREKRGATWVKNGKLVRRIKGTTYSPHYPK